MKPSPTTHSVCEFPLSLQAQQVISMPSGASILCVDEQNGGICLWAEVVPEHSPEERTFLIYGTGHSIDPSTEKRYIGTACLPHGLVFHVFEQVAAAAPSAKPATGA